MMVLPLISSVLQQVNTKGDEIAQLATTYTANEIAFFKRVVDVASQVVYQHKTPYANRYYL